MKQVHGNPTSNFNISTTTYAFDTTGPSGTINASVDMSALKCGQSMILSIDGGTAEGFTDQEEYFVIPVSSGVIRIADSKEDAMDGNYISGASGDASTGTIYPIYKVGGVLVTNTAGNLYIRGLQNADRGLDSFSLQVTTSNGDILPFMIKDIMTSGLTADKLVVWMD